VYPESRNSVPCLVLSFEEQDFLQKVKPYLMEPYCKTIVCVDDDPDDLTMLRQAIEELGTDHRIVEAFDGVHALELLQQMHDSGAIPCLVVLDINMPRMDGKQTLVAIRVRLYSHLFPLCSLAPPPASWTGCFAKRKM
jgi:response regulator RpfG family c-di-GMP phosphodiesterase